MSLNLVLQHVLSQKSQRDAYIQSPLFTFMCQALRAQPAAVMLDSESAGYSHEATVATADWPDDVTPEQVAEFFDALGDAYAQSVDQSTRTELDMGPFYGEVFEHHGLWVTVLSGQGSIIVVRNKIAYEAWRQTQAELRDPDPIPSDEVDNAEIIVMGEPCTLH